MQILLKGDFDLNNEIYFFSDFCLRMDVEDFWFWMLKEGALMVFSFLFRNEQNV